MPASAASERETDSPAASEVPAKMEVDEAEEQREREKQPVEEKEEEAVPRKERASTSKSPPRPAERQKPRQYEDRDRTQSASPRTETAASKPSEQPPSRPVHQQLPPQLQERRPSLQQHPFHPHTQTIAPRPLHGPPSYPPPRGQVIAHHPPPPQYPLPYTGSHPPPVYTWRGPPPGPVVAYPFDPNGVPIAIPAHHQIQDPSLPPGAIRLGNGLIAVPTAFPPLQSPQHAPPPPAPQEHTLHHRPGPQHHPGMTVLEGPRPKRPRSTSKPEKEKRATTSSLPLDATKAILEATLEQEPFSRSHGEVGPAWSKVMRTAHEKGFYTDKKVDFFPRRVKSLVRSVRAKAAGENEGEGDGEESDSASGDKKEKAGQAGPGFDLSDPALTALRPLLDKIAEQMSGWKKRSKRTVTNKAARESSDPGETSQQQPRKRRRTMASGEILQGVSGEGGVEEGAKEPACPLPPVMMSREERQHEIMEQMLQCARENVALAKEGLRVGLDTLMEVRQLNRGVEELVMGRGERLMNGSGSAKK